MPTSKPAPKAPAKSQPKPAKGTKPAKGAKPTKGTKKGAAALTPTPAPRRKRTTSYKQTAPAASEYIPAPLVVRRSAEGKPPRRDPPPEVTRTGGGMFDPNEENVYFIASNVERMKYGATQYEHILVAVNELEGSDAFTMLETWLDQGKKVFLDSGVFNLAMTHARNHNISHDQGLNLAPDEVDGFQDLFDRYVEIVRKYGDRLWGYVEIDQGGRENKIKTRAKLEALGLHPIPVYHPFGDGWDYFDELAKGYDRICHGNVVQAESPVRKRFVATAWERHRRYKYLWIHLLGLTPNLWLNALPIDSGDSSSWLATVRWTTHRVSSLGGPFGYLPHNFRYVLGSDPNDPNVGSQKATKLSAYQQYMDMRCWRAYLNDLQERGYSLYPPPTQEMLRANGETAP